MDTRHVAIWMRVSTKRQDHRSQERDLRAWAEHKAEGEAVVWYADKGSGRSLDHEAWHRLEVAYRTGLVSRIVVWRLDRIGRTSSGLTALFDELRELGVPLYSITEGFDLFTPAGRMVATILASVAQHELEVRGERQAAGIAAAKAAGKSWGGRAKGSRWKVTEDTARVVRKLAEQGESVAAIARATHLSRPTVYSVLGA